jgi:hypothetical protein
MALNNSRVLKKKKQQQQEEEEEEEEGRIYSVWNGSSSCISSRSWARGFGSFSFYGTIAGKAPFQLHQFLLRDCHHRDHGVWSWRFVLMLLSVGIAPST